jgi:hypothetical protein
MIGGGPPTHGGILQVSCGLYRPAFTSVFTFIPEAGLVTLVLICILSPPKLGRRRPRPARYSTTP